MPAEVLAVLRGQLRPAVLECYNAEAARVARAVAASEGDRASTAADSISFVSTRLVQLGSELAETLRKRLAGAWQPAEVRTMGLLPEAAPNIFDDGEKWQRRCASALEDLRCQVGAFFEHGGSMRIEKIEAGARALEVELSEILCTAVANAAQQKPRELMRRSEPVTPQQQAAAQTLQRALRGPLNARARRSAQRAAQVRADLEAALVEYRALREGASHATLVRVSNALSQSLEALTRLQKPKALRPVLDSTRKAFEWIDGSAARAAKAEVVEMQVKTRKEEQRAKELIRKHEKHATEAKQAEEQLQQAKRRGEQVHPQTLENLGKAQTELARSRQSLFAACERGIVQHCSETDEFVVPSDSSGARSGGASSGKRSSSDGGGAEASNGAKPWMRNFPDALDLSREKVDEMTLLLSNMREEMVDACVGPERAMQKACAALKEAALKVMGSAMVAHEEVMEKPVAEVAQCEAAVQQLQKKRAQASSKVAFDREHGGKLEQQEQRLKELQKVVRNGQELGKKLNGAMHVLQADVAAALGTQLDAWCRAMHAELLPLRGERVEVVRHATNQLPGTAEGQLFAAASHVAGSKLSSVQTRALLRRATALLYERCATGLAKGLAYSCALCDDLQPPSSNRDADGVLRLCSWSPRVCSASQQPCWMEGRAEETFAVAQLLLQPLPAFRWLELEENATEDEVARAYRHASRIHHHDKGGSPELLELTQLCGKLLRDKQTLETYLAGRNHEEFVASRQEDLSLPERLKRMQQATEHAATSSRPSAARKKTQGFLEDLSLFPSQMPRIHAKAVSPTEVRLEWASKLNDYWLSLVCHRGSNHKSTHLAAACATSEARRGQGAVYEVDHGRSCGHRPLERVIVYRGPATMTVVGELLDDDPEYVSTQLFRVRLHSHTHRRTRVIA